MKLLMGAAAAAATLAIAAVPASFTLTSGGTESPDPVVTTSTTETPTADPTTDATTDPTIDPTRGWEVEHPNSGQHKGWENGHHAYGESARSWAKCVSTQGKDNCTAKPDPYGKTKKQDTSTATADPTTDPTTEPTTDPTAEPTDG